MSLRFWNIFKSCAPDLYHFHLNYTPKLLPLFDQLLKSAILFNRNRGLWQNNDLKFRNPTFFNIRVCLGDCLISRLTVKYESIEFRANFFNAISSFINPPSASLWLDFFLVNLSDARKVRFYIEMSVSSFMNSNFDWRCD